MVSKTFSTPYVVPMGPQEPKSDDPPSKSAEKQPMNSGVRRGNDGGVCFPVGVWYVLFVIICYYYD